MRPLILFSARLLAWAMEGFKPDEVRYIIVFLTIKYKVNMERKLQDKTEATQKIAYSFDSTTGKVTGTVQKTLKDDTTGESVNDGDPETLVLSDDENAAYAQGADALLGVILDARVPAVPATQS